MRKSESGGVEGADARHRGRGVTAASLNRRQVLRRAAAVGAGLAAAPVLLRGAAARQEIPRAKSSAAIDGALRVLLKDDFHPDHNAFVRAEIEAFADLNGWQLELTDVAGYQGGGDLFQKLLGGVQADDSPDLLIHEVDVRNMHTLGLLEPVTALVEELAELNGPPVPGMRFDANFDDEWWAVPFFTRANGMYMRQDVFAEAGLDPIEDTDTYDKMRDAALKLSDPSAQRWGWGMTVNRSGDGAGLVQNVIFRFGGHLQDESGQKVTFNSPETVAALEWLKATYTDPAYAAMLPPGVLSWTDPSNNEAFLAGQSVITQNAGTMYAKAHLDKVPFADQIVLVPLPKRNSDGQRLDFLRAGMRGFMIKGTKNGEAAADLMRHLLTQPVQDRIWTISTAYALPAYVNGWESPIITGNENSMRAKEMTLTESGFSGLAWPGPESAATASIASGVAYTDMVAAAIQGQPVEEVVEEYHQQFVQIYQDFGFDGE